MKKYWVFTVLFLLSVKMAYAEPVFVFNPEARMSKIENVKSELEDYLKSKGINSQAYIFANSDDFANSIGRLKPDLAIIASYYHTAMQKQYNWKVILSGYNKDAKAFNKVLVTSSAVADPVSLKNKSMAAVSAGTSAESYIESQLPSGLSVKDIRIVNVSKDIDAIMALGFEQVESAIVTKASFAKLKQINPDVVKNLHILQELNPVEYPKIVAFPNAENIQKYTEVFQGMSYEGQTKEILKFFDITEFKAD